MPHSEPVRYTIDGNGRIAAVNEAWDQFALDNDGVHLQSGVILGQRLFSFIADPTTRHLYLTMLERVRTLRKPLVVHFRCDAPAQRREMRLELRSIDDREDVEFVVTTLRDDARVPVSLIDAHAMRDTRLLRMCGWCKRVHLPNQLWVEVEEAIGPLEIFADATVPRLSHGICERCEAEVLAALDGSLPSTAA